MGPAVSTVLRGVGAPWDTTQSGNDEDSMLPDPLCIGLTEDFIQLTSTGTGHIVNVLALPVMRAWAAGHQSPPSSQGVKLYRCWQISHSPYFPYR